MKMQEYNFTSEEITYLMDTLQLVLADINAIYEMSELSSLSVNVDVPKYEGDLKLSVSKNNIEIIENYCLARFSCSKLNRKNKGQYNNSYEWNKESYNIMFRFLAGYKDIRKQLVEKAKDSLGTKDSLMDEIKKLRTNFTSEIYVDFGTTSSMNQHKLEVTEEDGKKIGTIDFGQKTIKVITAGEIVLTHTQKAEEKVKSLVQ